MESGLKTDVVRFSKALSELDEVAQTVYHELSALVGDDRFLTVTMADAITTIHDKTGHPVGAVRNGYRRLLDAGLLERHGERRDTRWRIPFLEREDEEVIEAGSDEELIRRLESMIAENNDRREAVKHRLKDAQAAVEQAALERKNLDDEEPKLRGTLSELRAKLADVAALRQTAKELLGQ